MVRLLHQEEPHVPLARSTRRGLAVAVTTVLTVTGGALSVPAPAAHATVTADLAAGDAAMPFLKDARLVDAGLTGFLTATDGSFDKRWTRYTDGLGSIYSNRTQLRSTRTADYLVFVGSVRVQQRNLKTSSSSEVFVGNLPGEPRYAGSAADAVFTTVEADGALTLRQHTHGREGARAVTGLPAGAKDLAVAPGTPDDALLTFTDGTRQKWALIDLATGAVHEVHDRTPGSARGASPSPARTSCGPRTTTRTPQRCSSWTVPPTWSGGSRSPTPVRATSRWAWSATGSCTGRPAASPAAMRTPCTR
ncbi:hypothetical protein ACH4GE_16170 [Streptomyces tendae]|uniref:hypothetical protein n=1 Tax=Streptomyces tendae TaxID=1932 RepID=UPI003795E0F3